jgi:hypothetical protein
LRRGASLGIGSRHGIHVAAAAVLNTAKGCYDGSLFWR